MGILEATTKEVRYEMPRKIQFEWELPDDLADTIAQDADDTIRAIKEAAVLDWVRTHKISARRASELMQMTYRTFLELMAAHRIPSIDYEEGWLERERKLFEPGNETNSL